MTQKKRGAESIKLGRDQRSPVEACESISAEKPVGTHLANVFHTVAQAKIMISNGGTRGTLNNAKRVFNELQHSKAIIPNEFVAHATSSATTKAKSNSKSKSKVKSKGENDHDKNKSKKKAVVEANPSTKPITNLSISTKDRIHIERCSDQTPDHVDAKLGLRSIRVLHKFITNSSKIKFDVRQQQPVSMKLYQGYGDQEREIGTLISF